MKSQQIVSAIALAAALVFVSAIGWSQDAAKDVGESVK